MTANEDGTRVRRAAASVGLWVGVTTAIITIAGVLILIWAIRIGSRREQGEHQGPGGERGEGALVVDVDQVVLLVIMLGLLGVVLTAAVGWLASRRAVQPLAEALRLQRNFVADASHEMRTPLTVLSSRVQTLERRLARGQPVADIVERLHADADSMAAILNDLLLSAEGSETAMDTPVSVVDAVKQATGSLEALASASQIVIAVTAESTPTVLVPQVTLVRCVVALIDNAIQHSPASGTVTVSVSTQGAMAEVRVRDEGADITGIAPGAVFERFSHAHEQTGRRGFGLGLALVRDVAVRFSGTVAVESTSATGTTFLLRLPQSGGRRLRQAAESLQAGPISQDPSAT